MRFFFPSKFDKRHPKTFDLQPDQLISQLFAQNGLRHFLNEAYASHPDLMTRWLMDSRVICDHRLFTSKPSTRTCIVKFKWDQFSCRLVHVYILSYFPPLKKKKNRTLPCVKLKKKCLSSFVFLIAVVFLFLVSHTYHNRKGCKTPSLCVGE